MRPIRSPAALAPLSLSFLLSSASSTVSAWQVTEPPVCGISCIASAIPRSSCAPGNMTCICTSGPLRVDVEGCVRAKCSVREQLQTQLYTSNRCSIVGDDRRGLVAGIGVGFGMLGFIVFGLRCWSRVMVTGNWWWDDWVMAVTVVLMMVLASMSVPLAHYGLGLDMWRIPFDNITSILYIYYIDEMMYVTALALTKVSVLLFYLKIFTDRASKPTFKKLCYTLIVLNLMFAVSFVLAVAFQCHPIQGAWLAWDRTFAARCSAINEIGWIGAGINLGLNLATILLPLPELIRLKMSGRKKAQIMVMFTVGFFDTIVSAVRLNSLVEFATTKNITQDYVPAGYWSTIEVPVGVVCACLPAIRPLFSLLYPKLFGTTRAATGETGGHEGGARSSKSHGSSGITVRTAITATSVKGGHSSKGSWPEDDELDLVDFQTIIQSSSGGGKTRSRSASAVRFVHPSVSEV